MNFLSNFFTSVKDMNGYQWGFVAVTNLTTGLVTWNRTCAYHDVGYYAADEDNDVDVDEDEDEDEEDEDEDEDEDEEDEDEEDEDEEDEDEEDEDD